MSFCEHCQGQRFDRARVLRALRLLQKELSATARNGKAVAALGQAVATVRAMDIPHFGPPEDDGGGVIH